MLAVFGFTTAARAEIPSWCSGLGNERIDVSQDYKRTLEDDDPRNALHELVGNFCKPDAEVTSRIKEFEAAREKWNQRLGLTEADWVDVAQYATLGQGPRMNGEIRINTNGQEMGIGSSLKRAWSSFDAINQYVMLGADAGPSNSLALDHDYLADSFGAKLTEVGRLAYVRNCIKRSNNVHWAMCQGDVEALDFAKLATELRAVTAYNGADKTRVRIDAAEVKAALPEHADKVKKLIASNPGYAKMFTLAAATRKEWLARTTRDAALLDLAMTMDDARATNSRKAFADCDEKTWTAWKTAMATVPAKKFSGMHDEREQAKSFIDSAMGPIVSNPEVFLASVALNTCRTVGAEKRAKQDILVRALGDALSRWPGYRGPRTSTETAIMTAGIELDDRDAKLDFPGVSRPFAGGAGSRSGGAQGVVASLKPTGPDVTVAFKKQLVKQVQCAQVKYSHRVTQIRPDGTLVYEGTCVKNETVTVDKSDAPHKVSARYLTGVKPGMYVSIVEDVVTGAWAKPGGVTPSLVFGVPVK